MTTWVTLYIISYLSIILLCLSDRPLAFLPVIGSMTPLIHSVAVSTINTCVSYSS